MKVEFVNKTKKLVVEKEFSDLMSCAEKVLHLPPKTSVNIFLVGESEIKKLNRETRKINKVTDVLSFPMQDDGVFRKDVEGSIVLGDIVICPNYAILNAIKQGRKKEKELSFLAVHGILHLCGYDHGSEKEQLEMNKTTDNIINCFEKI